MAAEEGGEEEKEEEEKEEEGTSASTPKVRKGQKKPVQSNVSRRMGVMEGEVEEEEEGEGTGVSIAWRKVCGLCEGRVIIMRDEGGKGVICKHLMV